MTTITPDTFRRGSFYGIASLFATLLCGIVLAIPVTAFSTTPRGLFSISSLGKKTQQPTLDNPSVDGISLRQNWADLEKQDGVFDFSFFDSEMARIAPTGKQVLLRVVTMAGRPRWVDTAVTQAGGKFFKWVNGGVNTKIPLFWDPVFLAKKTAMIQALGAHFASNPSITLVSASFANATTEDWNVPHTPDLIPQWQRLGYTTAVMTAAGQTIINATMAAFPNQQVTMAIGGTGNQLDGGDDVLCRAVGDWAHTAWPGRFTVQKNDLSTCIPLPPGEGFIYNVIFDYEPGVAGQFINFVYLDTSYRVNCGVINLDYDLVFLTAIGDALLYSEQFVEGYEVDMGHLLPTTIALAHTEIINQP